MPFTNEDGQGFTSTSFSLGNAIMPEDISSMSDNDDVMRDGKSFAIAGYCSTAVDVVAETGGAFYFALRLNDGTPATVVNASEMGGITPDGFASFGLKNRIISVRCMRDTAANTGDADDLLPGGADDYKLFSPTGISANWNFDFEMYSGAGGSGGNYVLYKTFGDTGIDYNLKFYVDSTRGDLEVLFNEAGGGDGYCTICGIAEFGPRMTKAT